MDHRSKFASLYKLIQDAKSGGGVDVVLIHHPEVLGDNYDELIVNLNLLADAKLALHIVPMKDRAKGD